MDKQNKSIDELLFDSPQRLTAVEWNEKKASIEAYVAALIEHDFTRLVELLYRVDISEKKLTALLTQTPETNSATLITELIIERQLQKLAFRQNQPPNTNIPEEERW